MKYNHFLLNSIQAVIQKTQYSSLSRSYFQTVMISTNFYNTISWNITVLSAKIFEWESDHWKRRCFYKQHSCLTLKRSKKLVFTLYFRNSAYFISLSDEDIKTLEICQQKYLIRCKVIEEWQFSPKRQ